MRREQGEPSLIPPRGLDNILKMAVTGISDSARLLREQYKDGANLSARIRLHQRFSTNRYGMMRWMFDQMQIPENAHVSSWAAAPESCGAHECRFLADGA